MNGLAKQRRSESRSRAAGEAGEAGEAMRGGGADDTSSLASARWCPTPHNTSHRLLCYRFPVTY